MNAHPTSLSPEARLVLLTAGGPANDDALAALLAGPLDWGRAAALAAAENALAPVWERVSATAGDAAQEEARPHFQRGAWVAEFRQGWLEQRLDAALALLAEAGIEAVLLKGAALARGVHAEFSSRPMRDLDLLVRPADAWRAQRLFLAAGWRADDCGEGAEERYRGHHHLPTLVDGRGTELGLELHTGLFPDGHPFRLEASDVWARSVPLGGGARIPSPEDLVIHLSLHFAWSHQAGSGAWRCFRDLAALVGEGGVHWSALVELARDARAASCCYWTLRLARAAALVPVPGGVLAELRPRGSDARLGVLERHFLAGLLPDGRACPSVRVARSAWTAALQPEREGHGAARPWTFERAPGDGSGPGAMRRAARRLRDVDAWRRYGRALFHVAEGAAPPVQPEPPLRPAAIPLRGVYAGTGPRGLPPGFRRVRLGTAPTVSVVVASRGGGEPLRRWLDELAPRCRAAGAELVVAVGARAGMVDALRAEHPAARFVEARAAGELRSAGVAEAEGDVVVLADEGGALGSAGEVAVPGGGRMPEPPLLSVVVPVHQGAGRLPGTLAALAGSTLPRETWELVVVDDGSTDETSTVAARWADVVVRLAGPERGPAYARNRGFEAARGEVVVFLDPELRVRPDTLARLAGRFSADPGLGAAVASLDPDAGAGAVARFHHHLRHWEHCREEGREEAFWAGCGAVRRDAFRDAGGFDEWHYGGAEGEDLELGRRLHAAGHRILLDPEIRVAQGGSATLGALLRAEFATRAVPRAWLRHHERGTESDGRARRDRGAAAPAAVALAAPAFALAAIFHSAGALAVALGSLAAVTYLNRGFYGFLLRRQGIGFVARAFPLHLLYYGAEVAAAVAGLLLHAFLGAPPAPPRVAARMGMEALPTWPPHPACPGASVWERRPGAPAGQRVAERV